MTRVIDGVVYEVLWNGQKTDESLLGDYPRPSTLSPLCEETRDTLMNRHGKQAHRPRGVRNTYIHQAKRDLARYGLR